MGEREPLAERKRIHKLQETWKKGRPWLLYDEKEKHMTCAWCTTFLYSKTLSAGYKRDAWVKGCQRLKSEVVAEHEASKAHREAEEAEKIRVSVQTQGGLFRRQMQRRDDATIIAMRTLLWLVKENVALWIKFYI